MSKQCSGDRPLKFFCLGIASLLLLAVGCGGGGGRGSGSGGGSTVTLTGSVYAGPVAGASVTVCDRTGTVIAGPVIADGQGGYSLKVAASETEQELWIEAEGGSFTDEASGANTPGGLLRAYRPAGTLAAGVVVHLTPPSTLVATLVREHARTGIQAERAVAAALGFTPDLSLAPVNAPPVGGMLEPSQYGMRVAAFSQLTEDLELAPAEQFGLLAALAEDLADDLLDGKNGATSVLMPGGVPLPEDVQNRYELALLSFLGSPNDGTGLGPDEIGPLPFAKVALTDSWRVEYLPVAPGAALGRTTFVLNVTERASGDPVPGLSVTLVPVMHMAADEHGTPLGQITDNDDGSYGADVYYSMTGGIGWGYWSLEITLDDGGGAEAVAFHPTVGTPNYALLRGQADEIDSPLGSLNRTYYLFDAGLFEEGGTPAAYRFDLFVTAEEDPWEFPAVEPGVTLHDETGALWTLTSVVVEVSLDETSWYQAVDRGDGIWSASGLTGLDPYATELTLYARLQVNGEQKTVDGAAPDGTNDHAQLTSGGAACCD